LSGPLARFQKGWSDMSDPLARFQRGWSDMSDPRPGHVQVYEGIDLPIYRPIYRLGRPIFSRFRPVSTRRRRFLGRPTRRRAPRPILGRIRPLFTPPPRFSSAAYPPSRPPNLSAQPSITARFWSVLARLYRFWSSRTGFGSSLDRSKWRTKNTLCY
jgi:UDP:flavonoid glycosyltransferase YjiC (YdhE family)